MKTLPALMFAAAGVGFGHAVMPDHWMPLAVLSRTRRYPTRRTVRLSLAAGVTHVLVSLLLGAILIAVGLQFRDTVSRHTDVVIGGILLVTGLVFLARELLGRGHRHDHDDGHAHARDHDHAHDHDDDHAHDRDHAHDHADDRAHDRDHADDHDRHPAHEHPHDVATLEHTELRIETHSDAKTGARREALGLAFLVPFGAAASPDLTILPVFLAAGALGTGAAVGSLLAFAGVTIATFVGLTTVTAAGAKLLTAPWIDRGANLLTAGTLLVIGTLVAGGII